MIMLVHLLGLFLVAERISVHMVLSQMRELLELHHILGIHIRQTMVTIISTGHRRYITGIRQIVIISIITRMIVMEQLRICRRAELLHITRVLAA